MKGHSGEIPCPLLIKAGIPSSNSGYGSPDKNWMKEICYSCEQDICWDDLTKKGKIEFKNRLRNEAIRKAYEHKTQKELAFEYGLSIGQIRTIINRRVN